MSTHAAKKRRIELASRTLSKPFRTPFKSPLKSDQNIDLSTNQSQLDTSKSTSITTDIDHDFSLPHAYSSKNLRSHVPIAGKAVSPSASVVSLNSDPQVKSLLRSQRDLERQLRELREELEIVEQANKIESESNARFPEKEIDGELVDLVYKWRTISREASEELFSKVKDRVNRMGGPKAWREMQMRQQNFQNSWDDEEKVSNNEACDSREDSHLELEMDEDSEQTGADNADILSEDNDFTMAMMLRALNIDLNIIGYDKEQERWSE